MTTIETNRYTEDQAVAIASDHAQTLVLAGPGSGKTACIVGRVHELLKRGTNPATIGVVTFTNAAARELQQRLDRLTNDGHNNTIQLGFCGTIHGLFYKFLHADAVDPKPMAVIGQDTIQELILRICKAHKYKGAVTTVRQLISQGPYALRDAEAILNLRNTGATQGAALRVALDFYKQLDRHRLLTYDTIEQHTYHQITLNPLAISDQLGITHILVDEIQDTNRTEQAILSTAIFLTRFYVGDQDQSIYGWRGANPAFLIDLASDPAWTKFKLELSYRCPPQVCIAATLLLMSTHGLRVDKEIAPMRYDAVDLDPELHTFPTVQEEKKFLADHIAKHHTHSPTSAAVLLRSKFLVAEYRAWFAEYGIAISEGASREPVDWPLILAWLQWASDPNNDMLAAIFIARHEGDARANMIASEALRADQSINQFYFKLDTTSPMLSHEALELLRDLGATPPSLARVQEVIDSLYQPITTVTDIMLALNSHNFEASTSSTGGLVVTTYHGAKGREWDTVYLPAFEEGVIPSKQAKTDAEIDEERRVAYVGITRAKRLLVVSYSQHRDRQWGDSGPTQPSRFIEEAGL